MPPRDVLAGPGSLGSVEPMPTPVTAQDRLITYQDMERLTGGRIKTRTFASYQSASRKRERDGIAGRVEFPSSPGQVPNPSPYQRDRRYRRQVAGLSHVPVFSGRAWTEWMQETDRGHLIVVEVSAET